ncbi:hypothetical protein [Salinicoccus kekensis]|uniref:hypothetical protein n=1 Tax=Salinicoccus kekensis TaxID=714307 RepID=UPI000BE3AB8E|nr:hypothetical protein [Salinicoccus kekensis]
MARISYGSIYRQLLTFDDGKGSKERPVFVLDSDADDVYFFAISTKKGKEHQRKYRPAFLGWRQSGLTEPSYILIDDPPYILKKSLFTKDKYIGEASDFDINTLESHISDLGLDK